MKPAFSRATSLVFSLGWALLPVLAVAADKTVELGGGKAVIFTVPAGWEIVPAEVSQELASLGKTIQLSPKNGANAVCSLSLFVPPDDHFADHAALKEALIASGERFVADTLEGKVMPSEFKTPHAFGYSATFTDKTLVGKPSERGNYKVAAVVLLYLPEQVVVTATILCDDVTGPEYAAMMALLRSLGARSTASSI